MILQKDLLARTQIKLSKAANLINLFSIWINLLGNLGCLLQKKNVDFLCIYFAAAAETEPMHIMVLMDFLD